jgi:hypothetical protein
MTRDTLDKVSDAAEKAKELASDLEETASEAADVLGKKAQGALATANKALAAPEGADLAPLLSATDLPELPQEGALGSLGVRLDREADLYRNVALRELGRVAWIDRVTLTVAVLAFLGEAALAAAAGFSAIAGAIEGRGSLFALAAIILAAGPAGIAAIVASSRKMHRALATEALERSRSIEEKIFQLAVTMEWRKTEPPLFQDALARLEGRLVKAPE